jgi:hypothetical protein
MGNERSNGGNSEETTPVETPTATLPFHRPFVLSLFRLCGEISLANQILSGILHDIRVATEPLGAETLKRVGDVLDDLSTTFGTHAQGFRK